MTQRVGTHIDTSTCTYGDGNGVGVRFLGQLRLFSIVARYPLGERASRCPAPSTCVVHRAVLTLPRTSCSPVVCTHRHSKDSRPPEPLSERKPVQNYTRRPRNDGSGIDSVSTWRDASYTGGAPCSAHVCSICEKRTDSNQMPCALKVQIWIWFSSTTASTINVYIAMKCSRGHRASTLSSRVTSSPTATARMASITSPRLSSFHSCILTICVVATLMLCMITL